MTLSEHVFLYCERGTSQALLAEPVIAASNAAFLLTALAGLWPLLAQGSRVSMTGPRPWPFAAPKSCRAAAR
jgi:hypothetical protein